jgi:hypothetical protein
MRRLALVLMAASTPALALDPLEGSRSGTTTQGYIRGQEVWSSLGDFGRCYAASERKDALRLVATRPGSVEEAQTYKELFGKSDQSCLGSITELRVSYLMVRGAIAEGLYKKKVLVPQELAVAAAPSVDQVRSMSDAALCYVGSHSDEARSLVNGTEPGSNKEFAAMTALFPAFAACVPPAAREKMRVEATLIRFRIAEAMWKLGMTPDGTVAAGRAQ